MIHLTEDRYTVSRWSGGATTQIAIMPPDAAYQDRDFLWRVSSATVEDGESEFTPLPDYNRWILLLDGAIDLTHGGGGPLRLEPYEPHAFDGGEHTRSRGRCTDFNLMLRKGKCAGTLRAVQFSGPGCRELPLETSPNPDQPERAALLYCGSGGGLVEAGEELVRLAPGESALLLGASYPALRLTVQSPASFALAEVRYAAPEK